MDLKMQFDRQEGNVYYFRVSYFRAGYALTAGNLPSLSLLRHLPRVLRAGFVVPGDGGVYTVPVDLTLSGFSGIPFATDVVSLLLMDIAGQLEDAFIGQVEVVYLPTGGVLPSMYLDGQQSAISDEGGFLWNIPQSSSSWVSSWHIAARSFYRGGGFLRPEFAFIYAGSTITENHVVSRCASTGPFTVCDGYFGTWSSSDKWYAIPGPTYPLGYWECQISPYGSQQAFTLSDWVPGIDLQQEVASNVIVMMVFLPSATLPFYGFPDPNFVSPLLPLPLLSRSMTVLSSVLPSGVAWCPLTGFRLVSDTGDYLLSNEEDFLNA